MKATIHSSPFRVFAVGLHEVVYHPRSFLSRHLYLRHGRSGLSLRFGFVFSNGVAEATEWPSGLFFSEGSGLRQAAVSMYAWRGPSALIPARSGIIGMALDAVRHQDNSDCFTWNNSEVLLCAWARRAREDEGETGEVRSYRITLVRQTNFPFSSARCSFGSS